jgi:hypothetical protein
MSTQKREGEWELGIFVEAQLFVFQLSHSCLSFSWLERCHRPGSKTCLCT